MDLFLLQPTTANLKIKEQLLGIKLLIRSSMNQDQQRSTEAESER